MRILIRPDRGSWPGLVSRPTRSMAEGIEEVRPIVEAVRRSGDTAVRDFTRKFDGAHLDRFEVPASLIRGAGDSLSEDLKAAIQVAFTNLETFHRAQVESPEQIPTQRGVVCWRRSIPIQSVGLYAPGGTAPLFSTVLHLGVPARIAGCPEIILCTPPDSEGQVHPAMLYAAKLVGITKIFRIGGAQAIAAMAYGTDSIPRVDKILGPGNQYVNAAKQWVAVDGVAVDLPAGPTELAILADETASAEFVAADVLSQAEHGPDSQVFVVATDEKIGRDIKAAVSAQIEDLPRADVARAALDHARIAVVPDPLEAQELINAYAAEHLILAVEDAAAAAESVVHAGSVFVGHLTPEAAGDYASGTNHTLPTGGTARAYSGVSVDSFVRKTTFQEITADGLRDLGPHVAVMAEAEGLDGHARAVTRRLHSLPPSQARRTGEVQRSTSETDIFVRVDLDGSGNGSISTGLGFFDHMLMQIARHGGIDLVIRVRGDLEVDEHHTVEDTAIALGSALKEAMGDKRGIERYGFLLPMDEALAQVALDLGGRSHLEWDVPFARDRVGDVPTEMWPHFFKSFCDAAACNLNIKASGENDHHVIEAVFKGVARSLRDAVRNTGGAIPSTKGTL